MAKQKIMHGATIETVTPTEVADIVAEAFSYQTIQDYTREKGAINLDATGAGTDTLKVPSQYDWQLERVSLTGVNALVQFFENQQQGSDLLEVVQLGAAGLYSDSFSNNLQIPANSRLVIAFSGGPLSGQGTYNLQIKLRPHRSRR